MKAESDQLGLVGAELPHQKPQSYSPLPLSPHDDSATRTRFQASNTPARALNAAKCESASFKQSQLEHKIKLSTDISSDVSVLYLIYPGLYKNWRWEKH